MEVSFIPTLLAVGIGLDEVHQDVTVKLRHYTDVTPMRAEKTALHAKIGVGYRKR